MIEPASHDEPVLDELARLLADRRMVDWDDSQRRNPSHRATLTHLRELELVMRAHQGDAQILEPTAAAPGFHWGALEVYERLGRGGFADVHRAHDPGLRRDVALKLGREDAASPSSARWLQEARRLAQVRHPNVLAIHGADVHEGRAGFWTELIEGETLEAWLQRNGAMGAAEATTIGVALCGALAAVHGAGLVHGDIKTRNVMRRAAGAGVSGAGDIVLMDFGAAIASDRAGIAAGGSSEGTPLAMAPELLAGGPATVASDLYALGTLLFRLVTARYPCEGSSLEEVRARHARGEVAHLRDLRPDLPPAFLLAVERALAPEAAARFASAAGFESALLAGPAPSRSGSRRLAFATLAVTVLAAGAFATWWSLRERPSAPALQPTRPATTAPIASAPAEAAVATPPALVPRASLRRLRDGAEAAVVTGSRLEPGDRLWLEFRSSEPVHVYVLDEDASGEVYVLFPMTGSPVHNPVSGAASHALPGMREGRPLQWMVTSADGRETFLIVAARKPLAPLEEAVARRPQPIPGQPVEYARLSASTLRRMRGVGEVVSGEPAKRHEPAIAELVRSLESRSDRADFWFQLIETETPER